MSSNFIAGAAAAGPPVDAVELAVKVNEVKDQVLRRGEVATSVGPWKTRR